MNQRGVQWVEPSGAAWIKSGDPLPKGFGAKARGLMSMPSAWVPNFFVLSPDFHRAISSLHAADLSGALSDLAQLVSDACIECGLDASKSVILRSNAASEDLSERGKYNSLVTDVADLQNSLRKFFAAATAVNPSEHISCLVQSHIPTTYRGHLSNERRVAHEYRDAQIQTEDVASGQIDETRLSYRRWRAGALPQEDAIVCRNRGELNSALRQLLAHAAQRTMRVHFEWVWDGAYVYVVQADEETDRGGGESPEKLVNALPRHLDSELAGLKCFSPADLQASASPTKLANHRLYSELGAWQPRFFQLATDRILQEILEGKVSDELLSDLASLTASPLIIRTCALSGTVPLLPRSGLLANADAAADWLVGDFRREILARELLANEVSLLCHHFIPATAAAYVVARPDNSTVYVESLWGVPEGLYYFPVDSYQVSALPYPLAVAGKRLDSSVLDSKIVFKPYFVAPSPGGKFDRYVTGIPWDWKASVMGAAQLAEMASFTHSVARRERRAVNMMWFVECRIGTDSIGVVPWYHEAFEERRNNPTLSRTANDREIIIATEADLVSLEGLAAQPVSDSSDKRTIVRLSPKDDQAIRNEQFAARVGAAAKAINGVIVLEGGTLSHVYYTLTRSGATVVCASDISLRALREPHEKLVRDNIPAKVTAGGESVRIARLKPEEQLSALKIKLVEEAFEVRDARREDLIEELADVNEIVSAIADTAGISRSQITRVQRQKRERRGGFKDGVMLLETGREDPLSGNAEDRSPEDAGGPRIVETANAPKLESAKPGAADRHAGRDFVEFVQSASASLTFPEWKIDSPRTFRIPPSSRDSSVTWSIEAQRRGVSLQLRVKVRIGDDQLELPLAIPSTDS